MDDLLDLNWSAGSSGQKAPTQAPLRPNIPPSSGAFDFLAKQSHAGPNYYSSTPPLRSTTPQTSSPTLQPNAIPARLAQPRANGSNTSSLASSAYPSPNPGSADAFADLLSITGSSGNAATARNESLADRQKALAEERKRKAELERKQFEVHDDVWESLGSARSTPVLAFSGHPVSRSTTSTPFEAVLKPSGAAGPSRPSSALGQPKVLEPKPKAVRTAEAGSFWSSDDFLSARETAGPSSPRKISVPPKPSSNDPYNFDALGGSILVGTNSGTGRQESGIRTPASDFDLVENNMGSQVGFDSDEDDLLGELGRRAKPRLPPRETSAALLSPRTTQARRSDSPPPHVVGQIVEMGFSPAQARQALSKTDTGVNVEAAMEFLLSGSGVEAQEGSEQRMGQSRRGLASRENELSGDDEDFIEQERRRRMQEAERRRQRRAGPSRETVQARSRDEIRRDRNGTTAADSDQLQEQAERIYAQASEMGSNVLAKATSLWQTGKERARKAYEEQMKSREAAATREKRAPTDGRPRWMIDAEAAAEDEEGWEKVERGGFRDDDEASPPRRGTRQPAPDRAVPRAKRPEETAHFSKEAQNAGSSTGKERADLLLGGDEPKSYRPANRHLKAQPDRGAAARTPLRTPSPAAPLVTRTLVDASSSQLDRSAQSKAKGNDHFKLGRFAEAESAYTTAITALPTGHLHLIPLHNNRAAARLKLGEARSTIEDSTMVIDMIGIGYHPSKETPLPAATAQEVKLSDALTKALIKRAQAHEMAEKWKQAAEDWETIMRFDAIILPASAAATRNLAAEGARRARRSAEGGDANINSAAIVTTSKPLVKPAPFAGKPADVNKSEAVTELRKAAQAQAVEAEQQIAAKDSVDARLTAWRGGKETNLRALLSSLDTVLWDEILSGGLKVGMHELIAEKQVKIKYMKVIARLHPDKLDVKNTTVEQRMLANGVFGTLSEAWQAFSKA